MEQTGVSVRFLTVYGTFILRKFLPTAIGTGDLLRIYGDIEIHVERVIRNIDHGYCNAFCTIDYLRNPNLPDFNNLFNRFKNDGWTQGIPEKETVSETSTTSNPTEIENCKT